MFACNDEDILGLSPRPRRDAHVSASGSENALGSIAQMVAKLMRRQGRKDRLRETLARLSAQDATELQRLLKLYLEAFRAEHEEAGHRAQSGSDVTADAP